jgi:hypothetical protein
MGEGDQKDQQTIFLIQEFDKKRQTQATNRMVRIRAVD